METLDCGHAPSEHSEFTTGYGEDAAGKKSCYACCAEHDKTYMREHGKIALYLTGKAGEQVITNWPGSLLFPLWRVRKGRHNIARVRYDAWFNFEGKTWHAVQYGDNTQIAHCRVVK